MNKYLLDRIKEKKATIAVIGLGYVGLPNVVKYSQAGYPVIGVDTDINKISSLERGISYIDDVSNETISSLEMVSYCLSYTRLSEADVLLIDVPTPIDEHKVPDLTYIQAVMDHYLPYARKGQLVILESTTYPTTTRKFIVDVLESRGFEVGKDIFVAYAPERIDPGNASFDVLNIPRVVGGVNDISVTLAEAVLDGDTHVVSSLEVAELTKIYENTYRFINISFVNELLTVSNKLGVNIDEVIGAASTKPFGFTPFNPTPAIGGHCIAVDPYYLSWFMSKHGLDTRMINSASAINDDMPQFYVNQVLKLLNNHHILANGAKIAILGSTYKPNIADTRMASIYPITKLLQDYEVELTIFDNHTAKQVIEDVEVRELNDYEVLAEFDCVIYLVNHDHWNNQFIEEQSSLLIDFTHQLSPQVAVKI